MTYCNVPFCDLPKYINHNKSYGYCRYHINERSRYKVKAYKELLPLWAFKRCNTHGLLNFDQVYFHKVKNKKHPLCKYCTKNYINSLYDPEKAKIKRIEQLNKRKNRLLKCVYGISLNEYNEKLISQKHCCEICNIHIDDYLLIINRRRKIKRNSFNVDHNHKTNKVRGLLCHNCNVLIGMANDSITLLNKAAKYLDKHG